MRIFKRRRKLEQKKIYMDLQDEQDTSLKRRKRKVESLWCFLVVVELPVVHPPLRPSLKGGG